MLVELEVLKTITITATRGEKDKQDLTEELAARIKNNLKLVPILPSDQDNEIHFSFFEKQAETTWSNIKIECEAWANENGFKVEESVDKSTLTISNNHSEKTHRL
jgi:hypothetical protein